MAEDRAGQTGRAPPNASFPDLACAKFVYGSVPMGDADAMRRSTSGPWASPRAGGAGLYAAGGMSLEATQEFGRVEIVGGYGEGVKQGQFWRYGSGNARPHQKS